jgi:hypothetical protein
MHARWQWVAVVLILLSAGLAGCSSFGSVATPGTTATGTTAPATPAPETTAAETTAPATPAAGTTAAGTTPPTPTGVYMVKLPIYSDTTWQLTLPSVTVLNGTTVGVTIIYQNLSSSPQELSCPNPPQQQSITINGQVIRESNSYCAEHVARTWTVPAGGKFPSWATFPVVPGLAVPFTLNNWYGFGSVENIQLIPFTCIVGPGGSCLGVPNTVPSEWMPTPPEWLTSEATGACVFDAISGDTLGLWMTGLGGVIKYQETNGVLSKLYVVFTTTLDATLGLLGVPADCVNLAKMLEAPGLQQVASSHLGAILSLPWLVGTTP